MKTSWVRGLDKERTIDVRQSFKEALVIRRRLKDMLTEKQEASLRVSRSRGLYDSPNWAYMQADASGYERALEEVMALLEDENKEN